jgi:DNA (cytosine-5)-methyltransferase 1
MTYGFPCTDISVAGKMQGLSEDSGTRSSLLWEAMKIVKAKKPKYLIAENVKNLIGKKFKDDFEKWLNQLNELGYNTYFDVLNAKEFGIPQNRERVFVVSIRKDIDNNNFIFPEGRDMGIRLKDILEDSVKDKYYLSEDVQKKFNFSEKYLENIKGLKMVGKLDIKGHDIIKRVYDPEGLSPTLTTMEGGNRQPKVLDIIPAAIRGRYNENNKIEQQLELKSDGITNTLTTVQKDNVIIEPKLVGGIGEKNFGTQFRQGNRVYDADAIAMCLNASPVGNAGGNSYLYKVDYKIRKLTPLECWRLMGFSDDDFMKAKNVPTSNSQLYKQAGNSIVVNVLESLLHNLFKNNTLTFDIINDYLNQEDQENIHNDTNDIHKRA